MSRCYSQAWPHIPFSNFRGSSLSLRFGIFIKVPVTLFILLSVFSNPCFSQSASDVANEISKSVARMSLKMTAYKNGDGTRHLNAVDNVIRKNAHDASGSMASLKLLKFDDGSLRYAFYLRSLTKLLKMQDFDGQHFAIHETVDSVVGDFGFSRTLGAGAGSVPGTIDLINVNNYYERFVRKVSGLHKNTTFRNVRKRIERFNESLTRINKSLKFLDRVAQLSHGTVEVLLAAQLETGFMLDRLDILEDHLDNIVGSTNSILNDPQLLKSLEDIRATLTQQADSYLERLEQAFELSVYESFDEAISQLANEGIKIALTPGLVSVLRSRGLTLARTNLITTLILGGIDELWREFVDAPVLLMDHFILSTILYQYFGINPVDNESISKHMSFTDYISESSLLYNHLKIYCLYMFFDNMKTIMDDQSILDKLAWISPIHYSELIFFGGEFIDRDLVSEEALSVSESALTFMGLMSLSGVSLKLLTSSGKCQPGNISPVTMTFVISSSESYNSDIYWEVLKINPDGVINEIEEVTSNQGQINYTFSSDGDYQVNAFVGFSSPEGNIFIRTSKSIEVKSPSVSVSDFTVYPENFSLRLSYQSPYDIQEIPKVYGALLLSDGSSANIENKPGCTQLTWENLSPDVIDIAGNTTGPSLHLLAKSLGTARVRANYGGSSKVFEFPVYERFSDTPPDSWFTEAVNILHDNDIIEGYEDGAFKPENPMARAEFIKILTLAAGIECVGLSCPLTPSYTDLNSSFSWAQPYVRAAFNASWLTDSSFFRPADPITRAEAAKLLVLALDADNQSLPLPAEDPFQDVAQSDWYSGYVAILDQREVMTGSRRNKKRYFEASRSLTRAEAAAVLVRAFKLK